MSVEERSNQEHRKAGFKYLTTAEDSRLKRQQHRVQIRKSSREDDFRKKRNIDPEPTALSATSSLSPMTLQKLKELPQMVAKVFASDTNAQFDGTTQIRKLLSIQRNPPINEVIQSGAIPRLVQFLGEANHPKLQFEAAWALTNIASGNSIQTKAVVEAGAVPWFIKLLVSNDNDVKEQAIWALGNISGESTECRDYILRSGAMEGMARGLTVGSPMSLMKNAAWTISNLSRGKPEPPFELIKLALPALKYLITSVRDEDVITDACWALSYLSDGDNHKIQAVLESGVTPRLVELLMHSSIAIKTPALRTIGNLVTGDDIQTQVVLDCNVLSPLLALLNSSKKALKKEACWTISNIAAGNKSQIQTIIGADMVSSLIRLLGDAEYDVKREAAFAIANATTGGSREQITFFVMKGCLPPLCALLSASDPRIIATALDALQNILKSEPRDSRPADYTYADIIEMAEGIDKLEALQQHENLDIYNKAVDILETFFAAEAEDANIAPIISGTPEGQMTFSFAAPSLLPTGGFNFNF